MGGKYTSQQASDSGSLVHVFPTCPGLRHTGSVLFFPLSVVEDMFPLPLGVPYTYSTNQSYLLLYLIFKSVFQLLILVYLSRSQTMFASCWLSAR